MNVICCTSNAKYIHTNLAIRCLKAFAAPEFNIQLKEYTIKDPVMNIVSDLYQQKPTIIGFSCYIWNIEETIKVVNMIKKIDPVDGAPGSRASDGRFKSIWIWTAAFDENVSNL